MSFTSEFILLGIFNLLTSYPTVDFKTMSNWALPNRVKQKMEGQLLIEHISMDYT